MNEGINMNPVLEGNEKHRNEIENIKDAEVLNSKFKEFTDSFKNFVLKLREGEIGSSHNKMQDYLSSFPVSLYLSTFSKTEVGKSICRQAVAQDYLYEKEPVDNSDYTNMQKFHIKEDEGLINLMTILYEDIEENKDLKDFVINLNRHKKISRDSFTFMNTIDEAELENFKSL